MRRCRRVEAMPSCVGGPERRSVNSFLSEGLIFLSYFSFASHGFTDRADKSLHGGWRKTADLNVTDLCSSFMLVQGLHLGNMQCIAP